MKQPKLFDADTERALVGAALIEPELFKNTIASADFHGEDLGAIWQVGRDLYHDGKTPDFVTLADELERRDAGIKSSFLTGLVAESVSVAYAQTWAATIHDYAERRRLFDLLGLAATQVQNGGDLVALRERLSAELTRLQEVKKTRPAPKTSWTVAELYAAEFPEPTWTVPGIIPTGLTFLAGRPKVGKSWLALQIAHAKGTGGMVLERTVTPGRVLYLALEDSPRRLRDRLTKQRAPQSADITFRTSWRRFTDGGLEDLRTAIEREGFALTVIDTYARALGQADQLDLADMTVITGELQELGVSHDVALLLVDHHRKPAGFVTDPIDDLVGSTAKSAVADCALGLSKEQGKRGAVLKVTGRDVEWQELALSWDAVTCCWQYDGTVEEVALQGNKRAVLDALRAHFPNELILTELASITGITKNNLSPILNDLLADGHIVRGEKRGREVPYKLSNQNSEGA